MFSFPLSDTTGLLGASTWDPAQMGGTMSGMVDVSEIWEGEARLGTQVNMTQGFQFSFLIYLIG